MIVDFSLRSPKIYLTESGLVKLGYYRNPKGEKDTLRFEDIKYGFNDQISPDDSVVINYKKRDIWFIGELLYLLLTFKMPFNPNKLMYAKKFSPPPEIYSAGIKDLLTKCLESYSEKRPSIKNILQSSVIKDRINNYLNEVQYDEDLYKILAKKYKDSQTKKQYGEDKKESPKEAKINEEKNTSETNKDKDQEKKIISDRDKLNNIFKKKPAGKKMKKNLVSN